MEARKKNNLELERKRPLFFNIGLVVSLLLVISAFEMKFKIYDYELDITRQTYVNDWTIVPPTVIPMPKPPAPVEKKDKTFTKIAENAASEETLKALTTVVIEEPISSNIPLTSALPEPGTENGTEVFVLVENQPEPNGGFKAFNKYIKKNMKYPGKALRFGAEGIVYVQFIVDKDGSLTNIEVIKGIGFGCDEEAARVIAEAPKWNPGKQRGKPVKVRMVLPLRFQAN